MRLNQLISFLLTEDLASDRLAAIKKRYSSLSSEQIAQVREADPDRDKSNIMWVARQVVSGNLRMPEDVGRVREVLAGFMRLKRIGTIAGASADLLRYRTLTELEAKVDEYSGAKSKGEAVRASQEDGAKTIFKDGTFEFVTITTQEAASKLCRHTKWCVKDPGYGRTYFHRGRASYPVMVVKNGRPWALLDEESKQAMDVRDEPISREMTEELLPYVGKMGIDTFEKLPGFKEWFRDHGHRWSQMPAALKAHPRVAFLMVQGSGADDLTAAPPGIVEALSKSPQYALAAVIAASHAREEHTKRSFASDPGVAREFVLRCIPDELADAIAKAPFDDDATETRFGPLGEALRHLSWKEAKKLCQAPFMARLWVSVHGYLGATDNEDALRVIAKSAAGVMDVIHGLKMRGEAGERAADALPDWFKKAGFQHTSHNLGTHDRHSQLVMGEMSWDEVAKHNPTPATALKWVLSGAPDSHDDSPEKRIQNPAVVKLIASDVQISRDCIGSRHRSGALPCFSDPAKDIPKAIWDKALSVKKQGDARDKNTQYFEDVLRSSQPWSVVARYGGSSPAMARLFVSAMDARGKMSQLEDSVLRLAVEKKPRQARYIARELFRNGVKDEVPDWLVKLGLRYDGTETDASTEDAVYEFARDVLEHTKTRKFTQDVEKNMPSSWMSDYLMQATISLSHEDVDSIIDDSLSGVDPKDIKDWVRDFVSIRDAYIPEKLLWMSFGKNKHNVGPSVAWWLVWALWQADSHPGLRAALTPLLDKLFHSMDEPAKREFVKEALREHPNIATDNGRCSEGFFNRVKDSLVRHPAPAAVTEATAPTDKVIAPQDWPANKIIGKKFWFEYHCNESHDSPDATIWYHSHQQMTILKRANDDAAEDLDFRGRAENACQRVYTVRFDDGFEADIFEDEICISKKDFCRPGPPSGPVASAGKETKR